MKTGGKGKSDDKNCGNGKNGHFRKFVISHIDFTPTPRPKEKFQRKRGRG
jgi:hypothetical protein